MIVTIDGPAGAGKSTVARLLAARLGFALLNTGAMYRGVALAAIEARVDHTDAAAVERLLETLDLHYAADRVSLAGVDVTARIAEPAVRAVVSPLSAVPCVRRYLVAMQRRIAAAGDWVCEGRDQGTIVFPNSTCKYFLTASADERARRRYAELVGLGQPVSFETVLAEQVQRDARDAARDLAPMVPAADATIIDGTGRTVDAILDQLEREVRACIAR